MFRFAIMGAGHIAHNFCDAVAQLPGCEVCAVASKSQERANALAQKYGIAGAYADYEAMLEREKPDCVYIAVTPHDHYALTMLCVQRGVPVLCEKAMFMSGAQARTALEAAKARGVFVMEAMWSRFLPPMVRAKTWLTDGAIGKASAIDVALGFAAPPGEENRYRNPKLGGGVAFDLTVYAYELTTWMLGRHEDGFQVSALWSPGGVDLADVITLRFPEVLASLRTSFLAAVEERMVIYGDAGKIIVPAPHHTTEAFLYDAEGRLREHFQDTVTANGFTYEIEEVMRCIGEGQTESPVVPHEDTLRCAAIFDALMATRPGA